MTGSLYNCYQNKFAMWPIIRKKQYCELKIMALLEYIGYLVYICKGGSRRGLKSGIKIIYDKTSRIKKNVLLNESPKLFKIILNEIEGT
jgi:hypothetical protein